MGANGVISPQEFRTFAAVNFFPDSKIMRIFAAQVLNSEMK
jgi:hypothetical protein